LSTRRGRALAAYELARELELVAQVTRDEEVLSHMLAAGLAHTAAQHRILEQLDRPLRAVVDARHEEPRHSVDHLGRDAADRAGDDGDALPQGFRDDEPEALAERLLDDDHRDPLERVHLAVLHAVEIRED